MEIVVCSNCGSEYSLTEYKIPVTDTSCEWCFVCGEIIKSWKRSHSIYCAHLELKRELNQDFECRH